ncbi:MAG: HNH endonuclease [Chloroflexi bacterium]|nr:HNH endonuclease [Chloroflexota bacterium]
MLETIESTYLIRERLGNYLKLIEALDPLPRERQLTKKWRTILMDKFGTTCGYCGVSNRVDTAHLISLEIGGTTVCENLILLCKKCHGLFDTGYLSIHAMSEVAKEWRCGAKPAFPRPQLDDVKPPDTTFTEPPRLQPQILARISSFQTQRKYVKAIDLINHHLANSRLTDSEHYYLLIKRAELTRRRSARGVLDKALRGLQAIKPDRVPKHYLPYFYYECGYVQRLRGDHTEGARLMHRSAEVSQQIEKSGRPSLGFIAASVNEILCQLAMRDSLTETEAREFVYRLDELQKVAAQHGQYWGGRWALNCAAHKLQVLLKKRDKEKNREALRELRALYYQSDLRSGWDSAARQTMSLLEGLTRVLFPCDDSDLDTGIGLLARSFVTRLAPRQRPEGTRDVGLGLTEGLRSKGLSTMEETCTVLEGLMNQTMDGTSVLWPWRTNAEHGRKPSENSS